ncbi:MAG: MFS transporter [Anaerolineae bacterium]
MGVPAGFTVYRYRWVVLLGYMLITMLNQLAWITFAAVTSTATLTYGVSDLAIGLLSMSFMIVYIVVSIPSSWAIDTWGLRKAVGLGAVLTGAFALLRGIGGTSYTWVLLAQIGIALGQPLILNANTVVAARWFPLHERATAVGLGSLAIYVGIVLGLILTPPLTKALGMQGMLLVYGAAAVVCAAAFILLVRERPPTPPCLPGEEVRSLVFTGLRDALRNRNFILLLVVLFIGLGLFNAVTTWIENIVHPRGFDSAQAGVAGGLMVAGGVLGALVLPALSDKFRKRVPFLAAAVLGAIPGLIGVTFAASYGLLIISSLWLGFFLLAAGPVAFQYGAETTYPAPEGTTNGLLIMAGQVSGIAFIFAMDALKAPDGSMTGSMLALIVLLAAAFGICLLLRESALLRAKDNPK